MSLLCSAHSGVCILSLPLSLSLSLGVGSRKRFLFCKDRTPAYPAGRRQGLVHMRAAFKAGFCSEIHFSN